MSEKENDKDESRDVYESDADFSDVEGIGNTDIKINPDYYIHVGLLRAQKCLGKDDMKTGFLQYVVHINHIENLCLAAKKIDIDYFNKIEAYKLTLGEAPASFPMANEVKMADYKLRLMMESVFDNKQLTDVLKTA